MADMRSLNDKVRNRGRVMHRRAFEDLDRSLAVPRRDGNLARSRRVSLGEAGTRFNGRLTFEEPYAGMLDTGTRPHVIRPRRKTVLKFKVGGRTIYTRLVNHPGSQKHKGWFTGVINAAGWRRALERS